MMTRELPQGRVDSEGNLLPKFKKLALGFYIIDHFNTPSWPSLAERAVKGSDGFVYYRKFMCYWMRVRRWEKIRSAE